MPDFRTVRRTFGILMLLFAASAAVAGTPEPSVTLIQLDPQLQTTLTVTQRVRAKEHRKGFAKLFPASGSLLIEPGRYAITLGLRSAEREWLLVPYQVRSNNQFLSPDSRVSVVSGCQSWFRRFLALDRSTLRFEPKIWRIHDHRCETGLAESSIEGAWSRAIDILEPGSLHVSAMTLRASMGAIEQVANVPDPATESQQAAGPLDQAPMPLQIGARLCKDQGQWAFVGFMQAVSPDKGKIQVRIVSKQRGLQASPLPDFETQITWESPDLWHLCE
ncbi:hypothetical protein C7S18_08335 [Ahniella affigens]|uniref:Uncharacterized protein n=1 Tax=Ahniella affigens TaxID=2021234 RepID=A0A2P1PQU5_9GAMM|nr:hypothetical protein [Ahniella affigens]AVP97202.1 hypothetical protein C7S18_08335 [Ahniella affigens]